MFPGKIFGGRNANLNCREIDIKVASSPSKAGRVQEISFFIKANHFCFVELLCTIFN